MDLAQVSGGFADPNTGNMYSDAAGTNQIGSGFGANMFASSGASSAGGTPQISTFNSAAAAAANQQAMLAYYEERLHQLEIPQMQAQTQQAKDQLAFQKAQQVWTQVYQESSLNGLVPNMNSDGSPAGTFSTSPTLDAQKLQETIQANDNQTALGYLDQVGKLRGPANYLQYLKVLQNTPQGIRDVLNRSAGLYAGQGNQVNLPQATINTSGAGAVIQNQNPPNDSQVPVGANGGLPPNLAQALPGGVDPNHVAAAAAGAVAGATWGSYGGQNQPTAAQPSGAVANPDGSVSLQSVVSDANNPGSLLTAQDSAAINGPLTNPLQWNARNVATELPTQTAMKDATYEYQGMDPNDLEAIYKSGLPIYGGPSHGNVTGLGW